MSRASFYMSLSDSVFQKQAAEGDDVDEIPKFVCPRHYCETCYGEYGDVPNGFMLNCLK